LYDLRVPKFELKRKSQANFVAAFFWHKPKAISTELLANLIADI
jgi:hypothetical protein